eukprot:COSAG02_NODE_6177_length_3750_cov_5.248973_6_plen_99_part_00
MVSVMESEWDGATYGNDNETTVDAVGGMVVEFVYARQQPRNWSKLDRHFELLRPTATVQLNSNSTATLGLLQRRLRLGIPGCRSSEDGDFYGFARQFF